MTAKDIVAETRGYGADFGWTQDREHFVLKRASKVPQETRALIRENMRAIKEELRSERLPRLSGEAFWADNDRRFIALCKEFGAKV